MGNICYRDQSDGLDESSMQPEGLSSNMNKKQKKDDISDDRTTLEEEERGITDGNPQEMEIERSTEKKISMEDFKLLKVLGKGSFGKVMLVEHRQSRKIYAMKVLLKKNIKNDRHKRHTQTERFILATADNQFLVKLRYAFQSPQKLYLVVDYMPCGELFYHLRRIHRFSEEITKFYAAEILLGISYMHENNMIYRDLKPENILLDANGHVKLADFGLSKVLLEDEDQAFSLCGTPEYLAPEILTSKTGYDKNCDWWSYGALIYEMLVGAPPFYSENKKEMIKKILTQPIPYPPFLSQNAKSLLSSLLVHDVKKRLGSQNDAEDLKQHVFFKGVDFDLMASGTVTPPYQFDKRELKFFDSDLVKQQPKDTLVDGTIPQQYQNFSNFTYQQKEFSSEVSKTKQ